jgi:hypothetical protein
VNLRAAIAAGLVVLAVILLVALKGIQGSVLWWLCLLAALAAGVGAALLFRALARAGIARTTDFCRQAYLVKGARWCCFGALATLIVSMWILLWTGREFVNGRGGDLRIGPFPKGMPVSALMNLNPDASIGAQLGALRGTCAMLGRLQAENRKEQRAEQARFAYTAKHGAGDEAKMPTAYHFSAEDRLKVFEQTAGPALMKGSKCPDFGLDRGHYFGEQLTDVEKRDLIAFLKTL